MALALALFEALGAGRAHAGARDGRADATGVDPWDALRDFRSGA
jgi:hypothetical protein